MSRRVVLRASDPKTELRALLGPMGAVLSGGVGGTSTVDLPYRQSAVVWQGHPPYVLTVELMLDGFKRRRPVEEECHAILRLARARPGDRRPPRVRVFGESVPRTDLNWLIDAVEWGGQVIRDQDGNRLRQDVRLTLIQDVVPEFVQERPSERARRRQRGKSDIKTPRSRGGAYRVREGDTLSSIAARRLGKASRWREIAKLNGIRDPRRLEVGQRLRMPS